MLIAIALVYPLLILNFLGGSWWGFAMRRTVRQGRLAVVAVVPSLISMALLALVAATSLTGGVAQIGWWLVTTGSAVALTLVVDHHLVSNGEAPEGWMGLRLPLSLGLGGLTILAGVLIGGPVVRY